MSLAQRKKAAYFSRLQLRGKDLNLRPLGYEPNELPLLHPATSEPLTIRGGAGIYNGARKRASPIAGIAGEVRVRVELRPRGFVHERAADLESKPCPVVFADYRDPRPEGV